MFTRIPAVFHIAPGATYIATTKTNKICCLSLVKTFTLQSVEMYHYRKGSDFGIKTCDFRFQFSNFQIGKLFNSSSYRSEKYFSTMQQSSLVPRPRGQA